MSFRHLLPIGVLVLGAAAMMCTPFKEDPSGDSGDIEAHAASQDDSGKPGALASTGDGGADVGTWPPCDLSKPFGPPSLVPGLANTGASIVGGLRLSPDSLTGYFNAFYSLSSGAQNELYAAKRAMPGALFQNLAPLGDGTVNTLADNAWPTVSSDGLTLFFERWDGQAYRLHQATRSSTLVPFTYAGPVSTNDAGAPGSVPFLREDGKVLYFSSSTHVGGDWDIYRAERNGSSLGPAVPVPELNTAFQEGNPIVTPDDLTIYFVSTRPPASAQDIWMATRASTSDPFSAPTNVSELNSPDYKSPSFIARGGCTLYFSTVVTSAAMSNTGAQYMAEKPAR